MAICRGFFEFVSEYVFVYVRKSGLYGSKPFLYVSKTFLFVKFSYLTVFLFAIVVAVMSHRGKYDIFCIFRKDGISFSYKYDTALLSKKQRESSLEKIHLNMKLPVRLKR